ncbi:SEA (Seh1-associated) complex subunit [Coemansia sp. RSA 1878]|nr:SEA (Seh1-associated) complex subunit [Coemansia sp. RSA 1878]
MSHKSQDSRKNSARAAKRAVSAGKQPLETLPEVPTSDVDAALPVPLKNSRSVSNSTPTGQPMDNDSIPGLHKTVSEQQSPAKDSEQSQRPRSRTTSPWRGRGQSSSIFARSTNPRQHMNRQGMGGSGALDGTLSPKGSAQPETAPNSAGLIAERTGSDVANHSAGHRRRGRTLDPEQLATRALSTKNTESNTTAETSTSDGHKLHASGAAHFHISTENTTLSSHYQKQAPQMPLSGYPTKLAKHDSASSGTTVATVEIAESPKSGQPTHQNSLPQGQLSKMLYWEAPQSGTSDGANGPFVPEINISMLNKSNSAAGAAPSSAGVAGRTKRGSSGESHLGDYKGALMRPQSQSIFGSRQRNVGDPQSTVHEGFDQAANMAFNGPVEIPGALSRMDTDLGHRRAVQGGKHEQRTGRSSDDPGEPGPSGPSGALRRMSSKDALDGAYPQQQGRGAWLYTPPGEQPDIDMVGHRLQLHQPTPRLAKVPTLPLQADISDYQSTLRYIDPATGYSTLHHRDSMTADRSHNSDQQTYGSAMKPASRGSAVSAAHASTGKFDNRLRGVNYDDMFLEQYSADSDPDLQYIPSDPQYVAPWLSKPHIGHKELLKFSTPPRLHAISAAPNCNPICALAGHEGLFLQTMTPDGSPQSFINNRRGGMALDFKDVVWRPSDFIITGSGDGTVNVWDPTRVGGPAVRKYNESSRAVTRLACKPDEPSVFYTGFVDGNLIAWDVREPGNRPLVRKPLIHQVMDIECNPQDPRALGVIGYDGRITILDMRNWADATRQFVAHTGFNGLCIAWHPNGRFLGSGGIDSFKVWDLKAAASKKYSLSAHYMVNTRVPIHRMQWRPGHETQLSWCTQKDDPRLYVWDMHNPHHSLLYHDKHSMPIIGFTWYDENTVWSASRDQIVIQCDMQCDTIVTSKLVGQTVADFSPNTRVSVGTGMFEDKVVGEEQAHRVTSGRLEGKVADIKAGLKAEHHLADTAGGSDVSVSIENFRPDLPSSFVDEHVLDASMAINYNAICYLARTYRYDPDNFKECCRVNMRAAATVGHNHIAKFWQFLCAAFGDLLPLKSKRKLKVPVPSVLVENKSEGDEAKSNAQDVAKLTDVRSVATSRSSSGMFPSKSVTDVLPRGITSDNEPQNRTQLHVHYDQHTTASPSQMRQNHSESSLGTNDSAQIEKHARLERSYMSQSHSNLQMSAIMAKRRVPSFPRSSAHSMSVHTNNIASEPVTPMHRVGHATFQGFSLHGPEPAGSLNPGVAPVQLPSEEPRPRQPTFALGGRSELPANSAPLTIAEHRHATKSDLKLIVDSCLYYANQGDVQTALTAALLMRRFIHLKHWAVSRMWFSDYIDQLDQYQEYATATEIILASPFDDVQDHITSNSTISMSCSQCGSKVEPDREEGLARCSECDSWANSCVVCSMWVRGRFVWCKGCGHGGHAEHLWEWFDGMGQEQCPSGCGHACAPTLSATS